MTSIDIYHYVYRITNLVEKKHYYGKRSSRIDPKEDLGKKYFSSSTNREFKVDQKKNPQNYKYKIIKIFRTSAEAYTREIKLHKIFDVGVNSNFYNKIKQTNYGIDNTGILHTEEHKAKIRNTLLKRNFQKYTCPHCGKIEGKTYMYRWHFDNCIYSEKNESVVQF